ncbi:MAG: hypothetical protein IPN76_30630 [Saprospiraceae bacterium]|nr:hypothetical protein [Saprospiraceae bacterium]
MAMDCGGFDGFELQTQFSIDPEIMVQADGSGPVKFGLEGDGDPATYFGKVKKFDDFTLPKMPGFVFSMKNGDLDLKTGQKVEQEKLIAPKPDNWRGLYLGQAEVKLPAEYDFTGGGKPITLDEGAFAIAEDGGHGQFFKTNLVSLDKGKIGNWRYSVDSLTLNVDEGKSKGTYLAGQLKVPVLDEPFRYSGELKINGNYSRMAIKPEAGSRGMGLWSGKLALSPDSDVDAVLKDFGNGKQFTPMQT